MNDTDWPVLGRDDVIAEARRLFASGGSVMFAGPAGVGKTALARFLADALDQAGDSDGVTRIAATSLIGLPIGAFGSLVSGSDEQQRAVPIVLDDVQLLDDDAAALVHRLVADGRVQLIATLRTGEGVPRPVTAMWKDELVERVDLQPLERNDVHAVIDAVLDGPVDPRVRLHLWEVTQGSPLMLRELIRSALDVGTLVADDGLWCFTSPPQSPRLDELIGSRLDALGPDARHVVELIALGEPLGFDLLRTMVDDSAIEAAEAAGIVEVVLDDARRDARLTHPMFGDVMRRQLTEIRTSTICRQLLTAIEATPMRRRDDVVRATTWQLRAGGTVVSDDMVLAARRAMYDEQQRTAIEISTRALKGEPNRTDVALLLALALVSVGEHARAEAELAATSEFRDDTERALVAMQRSVTLFWGMGDGAAAEQLLDDTYERLQPGPWRDEVRAERGVIASNQGHHRVAAAMVDPLIADPDVADRVLVTAAISGCGSRSVDGRCLDAIELCARAFEVCSRLGRQPALTTPGIFIVSQITGMTEAGQLADAEALCRAALDHVVADGRLEGQAWFSMLLGRCLLFRGAYDEAVERFTESSVSFAAFHTPGQQRWALAGAVMAAAMLGDRDRAHVFHAEMEERRGHPGTMMEIEARRAGAYLLQLDGDAAGAIAHLRAIISEFAEHGAMSLIGGLLHDIVRFGGTVTDEEWAMLDGHQGQLAPLRVELGSAVAAGDATRVEACAERWAELGSPIHAAEAFLLAADISERAGATRVATRCRQRAAALRADIDGDIVLTLDRSVPTTGVGALTERELEIARLASAGRMNKEIAEELYVSVRTVENHLQHVYEKLGVAGRRHLADAL